MSTTRDTVNIRNFHLSVIKKTMKCFFKAQPDSDSERKRYYTNSPCLKWAKGLIKTWYLRWIQKFREGFSKKGMLN